jgi:hypothetical protein
MGRRVMTINFGKWERTYQDGTKDRLACVRTDHYLSRDALAGLLIAALEPECLEDIVKDLPKGEIEKAIREQLARNASAANSWRIRYIPGGELGYIEVLEWAQRQIDILTDRKDKPRP